MQRNEPISSTASIISRTSTLAPLAAYIANVKKAGKKVPSGMLHAAVDENDLDKVELLIKSGVCDLTDKNRKTGSSISLQHTDGNALNIESSLAASSNALI